MSKRLLWIALLVLLTGTLSGCRQSAQPTPTPTADLKISMEMPAAPFRVGQSTLLITVRDAQDQPVNDALIEVTGDMTHAGMMPVSGKVESGTEGKYEVPFNWSMGGDWILTVKATLPDGRTASQRFDLTVNAQ